MKNQVKQALIDNYLDLLLYARSINDSEWQEEIKGKLLKCSTDCSENPGLSADDLEAQYFAVNRSILDIYQDLHGQNAISDGVTTEKLLSLKKRRIELGRQIDLLKAGKQDSFR
ncbi:MAG: hypothetical protein ABF651_11165 [Sporolactobacillus sp.]